MANRLRSFISGFMTIRPEDDVPAPVAKHFRHNVTVATLDLMFFIFGDGFGSITTIVPVFAATLTKSPLLIGLIPALHVLCWQFPQLFTARSVSRLRRYKPTVMTMTIQERLPYLGLAAIAWFVPTLGNQVALVLTFLMLIWQGVGGGLTATAWQSMIGKIIPGDRWGIFYGLQASSSNLLASVSAVLAGILLERSPYPLDFTLCFLVTSAAMIVSWVFLAQTREPDSQPIASRLEQGSLWTDMKTILRRDVNFRWFVIVRILYQFALMSFAFYTVYAVRSYGMSESLAGIMTGVLTAVQMAANPLLGWLGDRWSHRGIMAIGAISGALSAWLAWKAPAVEAFYLVFVLAGISNVAFWTIGLAMTLQFGKDSERPVYIGLANTLVAPAAFLVPLFGGWLADTSGYAATFIASIAGGAVTALILAFMFRDQKRLPAHAAKN